MRYSEAQFVRDGGRSLKAISVLLEKYRHGKNFPSP